MVANLVTQDFSALAGLPQANNDDHLIEMWMQSHRSECTRKAYTRAINRLRGWLSTQGCLLLQSVNAVLLLDYAKTFPGQWSDATRNLHKAAIKSLWSFGCKLKYFPFNIPCAVYKLSKPRPVTAERIVTSDEMQTILGGERRPYARLLLRFLFSTGVRISEALAVTWGDFHVRGGKIFLKIEHGKGDQFREIGCPYDVYLDLLEFRPDDATNSDPVFSFCYMTAYRYVRSAFERIRKPGSPHWARHAHAVVAHENGADWHAIQRQLGHKSAAFTMDRYGHFTGDHSSDFVDV